MKGKTCIIIFIFLSIILLSSVQAFTVQGKNSSYAPRETGILSIKGVFYESITADKIELKRNNVIIPMDYKIQNFGNEYIIWFIAPEIPNNYTLWLKDISTSENGAQVRKDFPINITVVGNQIEYNVKPETFNPSNNFSLLITSYADDVKIVSINFPTARDITLNPGENLFTMPVTSIYGTQKVVINVGMYSIPVLVTGTAKTPYETEDYDVQFSDGSIEREETIYILGYTFNFSLINKLNSEIKGLRIAYNKTLFTITPDKEFSLAAKGEKKFEVKLKETIRNNVEEEIIFTYSNITLRLPVTLEIKAIRNLTRNTTNGNETIDFSKFYCQELSGVLCAPEEECSVATKASLNGACCTGVCQQKKESGGSWIGIILFIIVLTLVGYVFWKYKQTPKQGSETKSKLNEELMKKPTP